MEASTSSRRIGGKWSGGGAFGGRRGAILIAIIAALAAGILIYVFVQRYKTSVTPTTPPISTVIVAKQFIPRGTPISVVEQANGTQSITVKSTSLVPSAVTNPAEIAGQVAAQNIAPGEQLTTADFTVGTVSLSQYLTGHMRALQVPLDATHGLSGYVAVGDHVDLASNIGPLAGTHTHPGLGILATNVLVLAAPSGSLVFGVPAGVAQQVAYASDNGKIWVFMRPPSINTPVHK
jgi:Flp pilus assembly protein CpaB